LAVTLRNSRFSSSFSFRINLTESNEMIISYVLRTFNSDFSAHISTHSLFSERTKFTEYPSFKS
jgi:hypothetical protein